MTCRYCQYLDLCEVMTLADILRSESLVSHWMNSFCATDSQVRTDTLELLDFDAIVVISGSGCQLTVALSDLHC